jgi:hydrogenase/urease accessory protein HupE
VDEGSRWLTLRDYFMMGVQHLLQGYDHLAFLLALVLPLRLALFRALPKGATARAPVAQGEAAAASDGGVWWALLRTVTAFTVGHSLTLVLATLGWTQASPQWVEPAIALTIVFTALLNLRPLAWVRTDVLALLFGMVHGYGFAGLLLEAAAPSGLLPWALGGFNLGVEAGQLIAVCGWVLLSQAAVRKPWYPTLVVRGGSVLLVLLATWWFWQRV